MEISNIEVAKVALCSEANVVKAVQRGLLDKGDLGSVMGWCLWKRLKELGIGFADELEEGMRAEGKIKPASELHYEPEREQDEGEW